MSSTTKVLVTLAVIAGVAIVIWLVVPGGRKPTSRQMAGPTEPSATGDRTVRTNRSPFFSRPGSKSHATNVDPATIPVADIHVITNWEDRVDQILGDNTSVEQKARTMLELLPSFPETGQAETAQHIANLLADEDYQPFGRYLTNSHTPEVLQDIVMADVLNRPNAIKLPLLLQTARAPDNAKAAEAKEILELYLEEDYGSDWNRWQQEMEKWLKENPD